MIYFTSDLHFFSKRKKLFIGNKIFNNFEEKNEFLIKNWNQIVKKDDHIYLLGDISEGTGVETNKILERLNGSKYLIIGNNDNYLSDSNFNKDLFVWIKDYFELHINEEKIILFHFPIEIWSGYKNNRIHLHGHLHNTRPILKPMKRYDVGVDALEGFPVSLNEVLHSLQGFKNI